jgi:hypothetical protein
MCSTLTRISTSPTRCWQACHSPPPHPSPPRGGLITRQFLGELEVRQILPPLLQVPLAKQQVPPAGGGNQQRLRSRGNLTEGVFKKCRAMMVEGEGACVAPPFTMGIG